MNMEEGILSTKLIDGDGVFNSAGLEDFIKKTKFGECGSSYTVVAILGPQSSGKSTLMNHTFHTTFQEMDARKGRCQITKGIWIGKCTASDQFTIAMDVEGTDGSERGEDDTSFERQSALFALTIADIVLLNMWCHDIGREQAANRPLLKTVFQVMINKNMCLNIPGKRTLLFVIRDKSKTPLNILEGQLKADIQKIWDGLRKSDAHKNTLLTDIFNVEVTALSSYQDKEKEFKEEAAELRVRFFKSTSLGGLLCDKRSPTPASGFSVSSQEIWKLIKENKDLDLPSHQVMVATVRCEQIAEEKLHCLSSDKEWLDLEHNVKAVPVDAFGRRLNSLLKTYLSEYDKEAIYFDESVRNAKRKQLESKAHNLVHPAYCTMLNHLRTTTLQTFKTELEQYLDRGNGFRSSASTCKQSCLGKYDKGSTESSILNANWDDTSDIRERLLRHIKSHSLSVHNALLSERILTYKTELDNTLSKSVEDLFQNGRKDTWSYIRNLLASQTETVVSNFKDDVTKKELELEQASIEDLKKHARSIVEKKTEEGAARVVELMEKKFRSMFEKDDKSAPRLWKANEDIQAIKEKALLKAIRILSAMTAIRLDHNISNRTEAILVACLMGDSSSSPKSTALDSSEWEQISPTDTLIKPSECEAVWKTFIGNIECMVVQAVSALESQEKNKNFIARQGDSVVRGGREVKKWIKLKKKAAVASIREAGHFMAGVPPRIFQFISKSVVEYYT